MRRVALAAIAAAVAALPAAAGPASLQCEGVAVRAEAPDPALARRVCAAASVAAARLLECGLEIDRSITIATRGLRFDTRPEFLAQFDMRSGNITVLEPDILEGLAVAAGAFAMLEADTLFDSLVAHELTHATIGQNGGYEGLTLEAIEYITYAMQIEALPEGERAKFLAQHASDRPVTPMMLAEIILLVNPGVFAARAWRYFDSPEGGCESVRRILDRDPGFLR